MEGRIKKRIRATSLNNLVRDTGRFSQSPYSASNEYQQQHAMEYRRINRLPTGALTLRGRRRRYTYTEVPPPQQPQEQPDPQPTEQPDPQTTGSGNKFNKSNPPLRISRRINRNRNRNRNRNQPSQLSLQEAYDRLFEEPEEVGLHTACENCGSRDQNYLYSDGHTYCRNCDHVTYHEHMLPERLREANERILRGEGILDRFKFPASTGKPTDSDLKQIAKQRKQMKQNEKKKFIAAIDNVKNGRQIFQDAMMSTFGNINNAATNTPTDVIDNMETKNDSDYVPSTIPVYPYREFSQGQNGYLEHGLQHRFIRDNHGRVYHNPHFENRDESIWGPQVHPGYYERTFQPDNVYTEARGPTGAGILDRFKFPASTGVPTEAEEKEILEQRKNMMNKKNMQKKIKNKIDETIGWEQYRDIWNKRIFSPLDHKVEQGPTKGTSREIATNTPSGYPFQSFYSKLTPPVDGDKDNVYTQDNIHKYEDNLPKSMHRAGKSYHKPPATGQGTAFSSTGKPTEAEEKEIIKQRKQLLQDEKKKFIAAIDNVKNGRQIFEDAMMSTFGNKNNAATNTPTDVIDNKLRKNDSDYVPSTIPVYPYREFDNKFLDNDFDSHPRNPRYIVEKGKVYDNPHFEDRQNFSDHLQSLVQPDNVYTEAREGSVQGGSGGEGNLSGFQQQVVDIIGHNRTSTDSESDKAGKQLFGNKFLGTYLATELPPPHGKDGKYAIVNITTEEEFNQGETGEHWMAVVYKQGHVLIYDSFGPNTPKRRERITNAVARQVGFPEFTNPDAEQKKSQTDCLQRSLAWLMLYEQSPEQAMKV